MLNLLRITSTYLLHSFRGFPKAVFLLWAAFLLAPSAYADIVTLTANDNGKQVQLNVGDQLVVRLPTISPRFGWRLAQVYPGQLTVTTTNILPGLSSGVPGRRLLMRCTFRP
ncbi:hypothetical protein [Hymenobacter volaticus]|uniref:Proteinase inhibitor I42 chagasin domain-containing protein n=1 Tax=Hymenobacter volaticus TaxID=2932254 RepID=A0ABY4G8K6_9BACT|nr:hypothetical protein [Hymenobacter volaticus]UOQ67081.1 hypothetical protein MUN86_04010 [Hymenobacter volaticus]